MFFVYLKLNRHNINSMFFYIRITTPLDFFQDEKLTHMYTNKNRGNLCINVYGKYYITKKWPCLNVARNTACISVIEPT